MPFKLASSIPLIENMPHCLISTKKPVLSLFFAVTVMLNSTSKILLSIGFPVELRSILISGLQSSVKTAGAAGDSKETSFK